MPCTTGYGLYIKKIGDILEQHMNKQLQHRNLTFGQSKLLMILGECKEHTAGMKELEERVHSAQSTVFGLVSRMEKKGLVTCYTAPNDRRVKMVTLTTEGEQLWLNVRHDMEAT